MGKTRKEGKNDWRFWLLPGRITEASVIVLGCAYLWTGWGNVAFFIPSWAALKAPGQGRPGAWPAPAWGRSLPEAFIAQELWAMPFPRVRLG